MDPKLGPRASKLHQKAGLVFRKIPAKTEFFFRIFGVWDIGKTELLEHRKLNRNEAAKPPQESKPRLERVGGGMGGSVASFGGYGAQFLERMGGGTGEAGPVLGDLRPYHRRGGVP